MAISHVDAQEGSLADDHGDDDHHHYHCLHYYHLHNHLVDQEGSSGDELRSAVRPTLHRGARRTRPALVSFDDMTNHAEC